ncbi:hypothetical protein BZL29_8559 [Mycobacterium kansasii]|uniref:Uncharacterized protein n=1 Tax=Mycobacterium kansasii TaxID=1768 RepID=A0A1V3W8H8_MYCKA|nr:hypothetical protein BZL29_8559 [Mycobacterium kansasii]
MLGAVGACVRQVSRSLGKLKGAGCWVHGAPADLSLGWAGRWGAGAVVAAKGLIRFPELSAQKGRNGEVGIDEVTEYFLVGSFASWLLARGYGLDPGHGLSG